MIQGRVQDGRASLPITFRLFNQPDFQIEFVVDTGFNDYLTLPPQAINAMNLPQY
jgi:predicted aspartyl protease